MPSTMSESQILKELSRLLDDFGVETIGELLEDPGSDHSDGELARLGKAFSDLGGILTNTSKTRMLTHLQNSPTPLTEDGVMFQFRPGYDQHPLDTKIVKMAFPREENPGFYTTRHIKDTVVVKVGTEM